jgi:hypothetical protein
MRFDRVRIEDSEQTRDQGLAGRISLVHGVPASSHSGVGPVISGVAQVDRALFVRFEDPEGEAWFAPSLVVFVDHNEGVTVRLGDDSHVRDAEGCWWREADPEAKE